MAPRRRRHKLPDTRAEVLYSPGNDRVTFVCRYKGGTTVEATYSVRHQRVTFVSASCHEMQGSTARLTDMDHDRLQRNLDAAVAEAQRVLGV